MQTVKLTCPKCGKPVEINIGTTGSKDGEAHIVLAVLFGSEKCQGCGAGLEVVQEGTLKLVAS